ncbi:MAG: acyl-CoA thioesterase II [Nannocystaceae bacterium]|nr:acyl-CoA thioesterase II [Nannocystaceae bacterium]
MPDVLAELLDLLGLERIEETIFRGRSQDLGWGNVFGGQVLGQALSAAAQTVPDDRPVHSLHGYFLRTGDAKLPIVYDVDCIRDGNSFNTRRVVAIQKGRAIFNLAASFQKIEPGFDHADAMPDVPPPESLKSERDLALAFIDQIPAKFREQVTAERPIEIRPVVPMNPLMPRVTPPCRSVWYRTNGKLPDDPAVHRHLLAYASDFNFLGTAMQPHGVSWLSPGMQVASLDHAMWFHRPFRLDDWILYDVDSPSASGARGLVRGRFFTRDGVLVASTVQEGLMRKWEK